MTEDNVNYRIGIMGKIQIKNLGTINHIERDNFDTTKKHQKKKKKLKIKNSNFNFFIRNKAMDQWVKK